MGLEQHARQDLVHQALLQRGGRLLEVRRQGGVHLRGPTGVDQAAMKACMKTAGSRELWRTCALAASTSASLHLGTFSVVSSARAAPQ